MHITSIFLTFEKMSLYMKDKIEYIVICISEFAKRHKLTMQQSFNYLKRCKGIEFLNNGYEVEHLFSIEDAIDDLTLYCQKYGGNIR